MPTVHFVNEHLTVEAEPGRRLSDIAAEQGILVCRELLGWTRWGDYSVWVKGDAGALSPRTLGERLRGVTGWRRLANHARVLGDVQVWTQQGLGTRNGGSRKIDAVPHAAAEPAARRKVEDEVGTALHPFGHPTAIGRGKPPDPASTEAVAATPAAGAAKPGAEKPGAAKPGAKADAKGVPDS
jgi:hypothetical protein